MKRYQGCPTSPSQCHHASRSTRQLRKDNLLPKDKGWISPHTSRSSKLMYRNRAKEWRQDDAGYSLKKTVITAPPPQGLQFHTGQRYGWSGCQWSPRPADQKLKLEGMHPQKIPTAQAKPVTKRDQQTKAEPHRSSKRDNRETSHISYWRHYPLKGGPTNNNRPCQKRGRQPG